MSRAAAEQSAAAPARPAAVAGVAAL